jgi:NAD(P)-dependent dehydrogenase (short-subunit alcohol dehydrogenase family)
VEKERLMKIQDAVVLVTGANRGIGLAFAREALARGARKVYAAARNPASVTLPGVVPVRLDVTLPEEAAALAKELSDVTVVVNNAGILEVGSPLDGDGLASLRRHLETNLFGVLNVSQAFAPALVAHQGGLINVVSVGSWLAHPAVGNYATSKAAVWGLTNNLRLLLEPRGVTVSALHMSYVDTDMTKTMDVPKATPESVVRAAFDGLEAGQREVLVDEFSKALKAGLSTEGALYLRMPG